MAIESIASPRIIAVYVVWKRRKGQPWELRGVTSGGMMQALLIGKEIADALRIPQSWIEPRFYELVGDEQRGIKGSRPAREKDGVRDDVPA